MLSNRRFRRPRVVVRAVRKMRAGAAAVGYGGNRRRLRSVPMPSQQDQDSSSFEPHEPTEPAPPPPSEPKKGSRSRNALIVLILVLLTVAGFWGYHETRTSTMQAKVFTDLVGQLTYKVEPGPSKSIRFPHDSPYDERLGYANLPDYLDKLNCLLYTSPSPRDS